MSNSPDPLSLVVLCLLAFLKETNFLGVFLEFKFLLIRARDFPVGIRLLKVSNRNGRARCEICSELTIKTPELIHWRRSGVFIVNFEHSASFVNFEYIITDWVMCGYRSTRIFVSICLRKVVQGAVY